MLAGHHSSLASTGEGRSAAIYSLTTFMFLLKISKQCTSSIRADQIITCMLSAKGVYFLPCGRRPISSALLSDGRAHLSAINSSLLPPCTALSSQPSLCRLSTSGSSRHSQPLNQPFLCKSTPTPTPSDLHRIHHGCSLFGSQLAQQPKKLVWCLGGKKRIAVARVMQQICIKTSSRSEI